MDVPSLLPAQRRRSRREKEEEEEEEEGGRREAVACLEATSSPFSPRSNHTVEKEPWPRHRTTAYAAYLARASRAKNMSVVSEGASKGRAAAPEGASPPPAMRVARGDEAEGGAGWRYQPGDGGGATAEGGSAAAAAAAASAAASTAAACPRRLPCRVLRPWPRR